MLFNLIRRGFCGYSPCDRHYRELRYAINAFLLYSNFQPVPSLMELNDETIFRRWIDVDGDDNEQINQIR